jgi:hypothetical protein
VVLSCIDGHRDRDRRDGDGRHRGAGPAPVLGAAPGDSTVRRTLELADDRTLTRIAQASSIRSGRGA